jgi:hypothetical protein
MLIEMQEADNLSLIFLARNLTLSTGQRGAGYATAWLQLTALFSVL